MGILTAALSIMKQIRMEINTTPKHVVDAAHTISPYHAASTFDGADVVYPPQPPRHDAPEFGCHSNVGRGRRTLRQREARLDKWRSLQPTGRPCLNCMRADVYVLLVHGQWLCHMHQTSRALRGVSLFDSHFRPRVSLPTDGALCYTL